MAKLTKRQSIKFFEEVEVVDIYQIRNSRVIHVTKEEFMEKLKNAQNAPVIIIPSASGSRYYVRFWIKDPNFKPFRHADDWTVIGYSRAVNGATA